MKKTNNIIKTALAAFAFAVVLSSCTGHGQVCDAYASNDSTDNTSVSQESSEVPTFSFTATAE